MTDCHITVYVPGLLGPQPVLSQLSSAELPDFTVLEKALSRADIKPDPINDAYAGLFQLFGIEPDSTGDYPAAAVCQSVQQLQLDNFCLRADPVHLQADMTSAVLRGHQELRLDSDEAQQLVDSINQHLHQDGLQLVMGQPHHWYLSLPEAPGLQTSPLPSVLLQDINPHLPRGDSAADWRRLMNEVQMLLYDHPVNQQREAEGRLTVNSLWLWGGGHRPDTASVHWQQVYTDDWLFDALARFHAVASEDLPESVETVLQDCHGEVLLDIEDCLQPLRQQDPFAWVGAVEQFQNRWLQPLLEGLRKKRYQRLTLLPANGQRYQLTRHTLRRWWRRRRPLTKWVSDGA
ncbi:hypothetical protein [Thiohalophilus sp.]|uniref:hypothetical protein n=1 Tax=Thiohalophilus sp. TaxID=3028392 RepID=UPI002ACEBCDD|nr:hypothetical protein [Thiohalophilus sp.]MDZ7805109.1 hypothetical protein [Thiohalophilus sp.]